MTEQTGSEKKSRKLLYQIGVPAVLILVTLLLLRARENQLIVLEAKPEGARAIARDNFGKKPVFDSDLPLVGRVTIPPNGVMPEGYEDQEAVSGILFPGASLPNYNSEKTPVWDFGKAGEVRMLASSYMSFHYSYYTGSEPYIRCPYVFGLSPAEARLYLAGDEENWIRVRVPASGIREPNLPAKTITVGNWQLKLIPKPWISPSFALRYSVTLEGKSNETQFVEMWGEPDIHVAIALKVGETKEITIPTWAETQPFIVRIWSVKEEQVKLKVKGSPEDRKILYEDGELFYPVWSGYDKRYLALKIGHWAPVGSEFIDGEPKIRAPWELKEGETITAIGYRQTGAGRGEFELKLPIAKDYEGLVR